MNRATLVYLGAFLWSWPLTPFSADVKNERISTSTPLIHLFGLHKGKIYLLPLAKNGITFSMMLEHYKLYGKDISSPEFDWLYGNQIGVKSWLGTDGPSLDTVVIT
jgi:hypothetical protein